MILVIILILLFVGAALVGALYSSFIVFYSNFGDTMEYNRAYYAAVSALERAELVLRYRKPWFDGTGGWMDETPILQVPSNNVDGRPTDFWYFTGDVDNAILRNIQSKTNKIPKAGEGNVDWMLITGDSQNFNQLDYVNAENFLLSVDDWTGNPYKTWGVNGSNVLAITGIVRLPEILRKQTSQGWYGFGNLDTIDDIWTDGFPDDVVVDWSFRGNYDGVPFHVMSEVGAQYSERQLIYTKDSTARESRINKVEGNTPTRRFDSFSPFSDTARSSLRSSSLPRWNIISSKEEEMKDKPFSTIMNNTPGTIFRISLLNLLKSDNKQIYPYLEYQFSFWEPISDRYYTIKAQGKYGDYQVELLVKKPTFKESILWSFTIIF